MNMRTIAQKHTFTLSDVQSVFYKIINTANEALEEKRFLDFDSAKTMAEEVKGEVVKVTKRMVETMEMETAK